MDRNDPARCGPKAFILLQADERRARQELGIGEGIDDCPDGATEKNDHSRQYQRNGCNHGIEIAKQLVGPAGMTFCPHVTLLNRSADARG